MPVWHRLSHGSYSYDVIFTFFKYGYSHDVIMLELSISFHLFFTIICKIKITRKLLPIYVLFRTFIYIYSCSSWVFVFSFFIDDIDTRSSCAQWILQRISFLATHIMLCVVFKRTYVMMRQGKFFMKQCLFGMSF